MSEVKPFTGVDDRVRLSNAVPLDTPFTLNIFPSNVCNFRCNYCVQSLGKDTLTNEYGLNQEIMSIPILEKIIEQSKLFKRKFKLISLMGHGEPLCNADLPRFIKAIKNAEIAERVDIITNGSLLTHEYSEQLIDAGLDVLRISLQGISSHKYQEICGANINFDQFLDNLIYFYNHKKQCKVYVKTMNVTLERGQENEFYNMFSQISDRMFIDKVKPVYDGVDYSEEAKDLSVDRYGNIHKNRIVCPQPFYMLSVWANGDVAPCDAVYKANPLGNVNQSTLYEMWNSDSLKRFCYMHLDGKKYQHFSCSRCCAPDDVQHIEDILDDDSCHLKKLYC